MFANSQFQKYRSLLISVAFLYLIFILATFANSYLQKKVTGSLNYLSLVEQIQISSNKALAIDALDKQMLSIRQQPQSGSYQLADGTELALPQPVPETIALLRNAIEQAKSGQAYGGSYESLTGIIDELQKAAALEYDKKSKLASSFLVVSIIFSTLIFLLLVSQVFKRLGESDDIGENVQQETANIMATVSEGLFLITREHEIGVEQSESIKKMFGLERDLEGDFFDFIRQYVAGSDVENAKDYIEILFGKRVKEKLIADLNPLTSVCVHISRLDGSVVDRFLAFSFKRVFKNDEVSHLLVSTTDITREVLLKKELEATREKQDSQIDLLMSILHVNNKSLSGFFTTTEAALTEINESLKQSGGSGPEIKRNIDSIYRIVHKVKGDSASLGLHKFEGLAHEVEDGLELLKAKPNPDGNDLLVFTAQLKNMFVELNDMKSLVDKVAGIRTSTDETAATPAVQADEADKLQSLVTTVSRRQGKAVMLMSYGMSPDDNVVPENLQGVVNDITTQLIRNSITHGIEEANQRSNHGKSSVAQIVVSFKDLADVGYELVVMDDGQGIDEEKVVRRAIKKQLISEQKAKSLDSQNDYARLVFAPGFSTQESADKDSGRGVGLDLVRSRVKEYGARIRMIYKKGSYCRFRIIFPKQI